MIYDRLSAQDFTQMVLSGHQQLLAEKEAVNALNIFPVPDGDTGTNMSLTMTSGVNELKKNAGKPLGRLAESLATGLLMGARGNSGVILSQLFRGFAKAISNRAEIDVKTFAEALQNGVDTAYRAVAKPVDGTILTVAKDMAKAALKAAKQTSDLVELLEITVHEAEQSLKRTPDLLPVLRQAGVVDSGGQGLVCIYRGFLAFFHGEQLPAARRDDIQQEHLAQKELYVAGAHITHEGEYGYCTEFLIQVASDRRQAFTDERSMERTVLERMQKHGDSLLVVAMDQLVKVHIHSEHPGQVLETALEFGCLSNIKIDNMTQQYHTLVAENKDQDISLESVDHQTLSSDSFAIVAVTASEGICKLLKSIGVNECIPGGQTMNPSTEDMVAAVKRVNAQVTYILPNNPNIIMAAEQCKDILGDSLRVIPTKSIPQAIAVIVAFDKNNSAEENEKVMTEACKKVSSGQITQAVRDSVFQDQMIHEGDYLGLIEGKVTVVDPDMQIVWNRVMEQMISENSELVTVLYGEDISRETAERFKDLTTSQFEQIELELHEGGQPLYQFLIGVE